MLKTAEIRLFIYYDAGLGDTELILETATKIFLGEAIKRTISSAAQALKAANSATRIRVNVESLRSDTLLAIHRDAEHWSRYIEHPTSSNQAELFDRHVPLEFFLTPVSERGRSDYNKRQSLDEILDTYDRPIAILGRPGYGKTTILRQIAASVILDNSFLLDAFPIPVVIRLRELPVRRSLFDHILELFRIEFQDKAGNIIANSAVAEQHKIDLVCRLIDENRIVLIIDGLDELRSDLTSGLTRRFEKYRIINEFNIIVSQCPNGYIFISSRTAELDSNLNGVEIIEICPLDDKQIKHFVSSYFGQGYNIDRILTTIKNENVLGSEIIPLTLGYLCSVFDIDNPIIYGKKEIYERLIRIQVSEWDRRRRVDRASDLQGLDKSSMYKFLSRFSYELSSSTGGYQFSHQEIEKSYESICHDFDGLEYNIVDDVMSELESHTGLFVKEGDRYQFSHSTVQDYLHARHVIGIPSLPNRNHVIFDNPDAMAMTILLSDHPSLYFYKLIQHRKIFSKVAAGDFFPLFFDRIIHENVVFDTHPYLGVAFLMLFTQCVEDQGMDFANAPPALKYVFQFLTKDRAVNSSLERLAVVCNSDPTVLGPGGIFQIEVREDPDQRLRYGVPESLIAPAAVMQHFVS